MYSFISMNIYEKRTDMQYSKKKFFQRKSPVRLLNPWLIFINTNELINSFLCDVIMHPRLTPGGV